jgi:hypothetical protein
MHLQYRADVVALVVVVEFPLHRTGGSALGVRGTSWELQNGPIGKG